MKGFIAPALAIAPYYAKLKLAKRIHFAFTFDEETDCLSAPLLIEELCRTGPKPAVAIVSEPTSMRVIEGHEGCYEFTTEITGFDGHGSLPQQGVNAVEYAANYISRLIELGNELCRHASADSPFDPPWATVSVGQIHGGIARTSSPSVAHSSRRCAQSQRATMITC